MIGNRKTLVTVLMPVFNSESFVKAAIESILKQTHQNFEFLIINDGSTDNSDAIIRFFNDPRIKYLNNKTNKGIVATLNEGLKLSVGKFIARMDADDLALPDRLTKQIDFLEAHPNYKLCGSRAIAIDANGEKIINLNRPIHTNELKVFNLFRNAFIHPAIMADASIMKEFGYSEAHKYAEDYLLCSQIAMRYQVANLEDRLLLYRMHNESITSRKKHEMIQNELKTIHYLLSFLFEKVDQKTLLLHHSILRADNTSFTAEEMENHLMNIAEANKIKQIFDQQILNKQLQKEWYNYLLKSANKHSITKFLRSNLFSFKNLNLKQLAKLAVK